MKFTNYFFAAFIATLFASCASRPFISPDLKRKAKSGATMAILPYNIVFEGRMPKNMSPEQLEAQDKRERLAFQQSLFYKISSRLNGSNIKLQSVASTNSKLSELNLDLHKIENYKPEKLAEKLGVDMVVVPNLIKHRYRSDEASIALTAANVVINSIPGRGGVFLPNVDPKTNDVKASFTIIEANNGNVLWSIERKNAADWSRPVENALDRLHIRMARKLSTIK
jgi:hypothetical protein